MQGIVPAFYGSLADDLKQRGLAVGALDQSYLPLLPLPIRFLLTSGWTSCFYSVMHLLTTHLTENTPESIAFFHNELSRDSLAGMVYLNPDYLSHLFMKATGLTPREYRN